MIGCSAMAVIVAVIISLCFKGSTTCGCCGCVANGHYAEAKKRVQVGKDQEKAQSEKDSHSKNRGGKKPN